MKVYELMACLSKCRADAEVWIGTRGFSNVPLKDFDYDTGDPTDPFVTLTSDAMAEEILS